MEVAVVRRAFGAAWLLGWGLACSGGGTSPGAGDLASKAECVAAEAACAADKGSAGCQTECCYQYERGGPGFANLPRITTPANTDDQYVQPTEPGLCRLDQDPTGTPDAAGRPVAYPLDLRDMRANVGKGVLVHYVAYEGRTGSRGYVAYLGADEAQATRAWKGAVEKGAFQTDDADGYLQGEVPGPEIEAGRHYQYTKGKKRVHFAVDPTCDEQKLYPGQRMTCVAFHIDG